MAFRCSRLLLAAAGFAFAILLQGCGQEHLDNFLELSCKSAAEHAIDLTEAEWVQKLSDECDSLFSHGSGGAQACVDEGSGVVEEDREAVLANYTAMCVDHLSNLTRGEGFMSLRTKIEELMDALSPNGTLSQLLETHLNTTFAEVVEDYGQDLIGGDHGTPNSESDSASSSGNNTHHESSDEAPHDAENDESSDEENHESSDENHDSSDEAPQDAQNESQHHGSHHGSHHARLFDADIRKAHLARVGGARSALVVCSAGSIALAAVLGFVVVRRRIRSSSPASEDQGHTILLEDGEQSEQ